MGMSIGVYAMRKITPEDLALVKAHNTLCDQGYDSPEKMLKELHALLGDKVYAQEKIKCPDGEYIEVWVDGKGDAMYGDGEVIQIEDFPKDTFAIRVKGGC